MNWEVFSTVGYVSVLLWLGVPLLWLAHVLIRPRRWIAHLAVPLGAAALVLASHNSANHVGRIQVDMTAQLQEQMDRQAMAKQAAMQEFASDAAPIRFAEDSDQDVYDTAGLNNSDLTYFESFNSLDPQETPAWRQQRQQRVQGGAGNDLASQIGAAEQLDAVEAAEVFDQPQAGEPIMMSDSDKHLANRMNRANLTISRWSIVLAMLFVAFDYVRRLNVPREAYFPLPIPSGWADAVTPRQTVLTRPELSDSALQKELRAITRRGEFFVLLTENADAANKAAIPMPRLPGGLWPVDVMAVGEDPKLDADFIFETLWFGRSSFVVVGCERGQALFDRFMLRLDERRSSRAHTRRTVHIVWDLTNPIPEPILHRFTSMGRATGLTLILCSKPTPVKTAT